jgi:glycosyltransferase involved in cell wall biosynthesis
MRDDGNPVRVTHLSTYAERGGAAIAANRLHTGLRRIGVDSHMLVADHAGADALVECVPPLPSDPAAAALDAVQRQYVDRRRTTLTNTLFSLGLRGAGVEIGAVMERNDVLHLHWVNGLLSVESIAALAAGPRPVVWTLHDMWAFTGGCHYSAGCSGFMKACEACPQVQPSSAALVRERRADREAWRGRLHLVTPSAWLGELARRSSLFADAAMTVIPNGLDTAVFRPAPKAEAKEALGLPRDALCILYGAQSHLERRKGFKELLAASGRLAEWMRTQAPELATRLHILSFGSDADIATCAGVQVRALGDVKGDAALQAIYAAADVFVLPSLEDNLPNTMLEAMACGVPVVAFAAGGISEAVQHEHTGLLVGTGDVEGMAGAIFGLLREAQRRDALGRNARAVAEGRFSLEACARQHQALYQALVSTGQMQERPISLPIEPIAARWQREHPERLLEALAADNAELHAQLSAIAVDHLDRARQIEELTGRLKASEVDRADRAVQIDQLNALLRDAPERVQNRHLAEQVAMLTDRVNAGEAERLSLIEQVRTLTGQLIAAEHDRGLRGEQIERLTAMVHVVEAERAALVGQVRTLTDQLKASETDRGLRAEQIESLTRMVRDCESERSAICAQVATLTQQLKASESDRRERGEQLARLTDMVSVAESDRAQRGQQVEELTRLVHACEADRAKLADQIASQVQEANDRLRMAGMDCEQKQQHIDRLNDWIAEVQQSHRDQMDRLERSIAALHAALQDGVALARRPPVRRLAKLLHWNEAERLERMNLDDSANRT